MRKPGGPHYRDHSAIKFAAGLLRVISVLIAFASIAAGWSLASLGRDLAPSVNLGPWPAIFVASVGLAQAVVLWAFADALILLADADDSHARIEFRLEQTRTDSAAEPHSRPRRHRRQLARTNPFILSTYRAAAPITEDRWGSYA